MNLQGRMCKNIHQHTLMAEPTTKKFSLYDSIMPKSNYICCYKEVESIFINQ